MPSKVVNTPKTSAAVCFVAWQRHLLRRTQLKWPLKPRLPLCGLQRRRHHFRTAIRRGKKLHAEAPRLSDLLLRQEHMH
jgi:hypothetical protein